MVFPSAFASILLSESWFPASPTALSTALFCTFPSLEEFLFSSLEESLFSSLTASDTFLSVSSASFLSSALFCPSPWASSTLGSPEPLLSISSARTPLGSIANDTVRERTSARRHFLTLFLCISFPPVSEIPQIFRRIPLNFTKSLKHSICFYRNRTVFTDFQQA